MLSFDEEVGAQMPAGMAVLASSGFPKTIAPPLIEALGSSSEVVSVDFRRIRVEDKRVINGGTDVNQLVPFKYKWAWEKYKSLDAARN